jgi:hypothetical protein
VLSSNCESCHWPILRLFRLSLADPQSRCHNPILEMFRLSLAFAQCSGCPCLVFKLRKLSLTYPHNIQTICDLSSKWSACHWPIQKCEDFKWPVFEVYNVQCTCSCQLPVLNMFRLPVALTQNVQAVKCFFQNVQPWHFFKCLGWHLPTVATKSLVCLKMFRGYGPQFFRVSLACL